MLILPENAHIKLVIMNWHAALLTEGGGVKCQPLSSMCWFNMIAAMYRPVVKYPSSDYTWTIGTRTRLIM